MLRRIVLLCFLWFTVASAATKQQKESAHIEEKIRKLDHATKQQILMMQHVNVPKDVIAKKISQAVGGSTATAHRVIDGVNKQHKADKVEKMSRNKRAQASSRGR